MRDLDPTFSHAYRASLLPGDLDRNLVTHFIGAPDRPGSADGVVVRVIPPGGTEWLGLFAPPGHNTGSVLSGIFSHPRSDHHLLVIVKGVGYLGVVQDPSSFRKIPASPMIQFVLPRAESRQFLIGHTFSSLGALDANNEWVWEERVCDDDLVVERLAGDLLECRGYEFGRTISFVVDVKTGARMPPRSSA